MPKPCAVCEFENPYGFKFCGNCGNKLDTSEISQSSPPPGEPATSRKTEGERRRLTVMFCDLVGSTALSHKLDPEDLRVVIRKYQDVCEKEVAKYDGHVAQYLGDGILAYFGYPRAHENDAHRAISSGLGILNAITELNEQLQATIETSISIRIGIHTGLVVIGNIGEKEASQQLALGAAPNIAAKLEGLAQPNTMVISSDTHELIREHFKCKDLGRKKIKGLDEELKVFQVISDLTMLKRFEFHSSTNLLPLVGRDEEVQQLLKYWEEAKRGHSHLVMLSAEAGMGKSRVLQTMVERVAHEEDLWLIPHQSSPYHRKTAFHPISQTMRRLGLKLKGDEDPEEQLTLLEDFLSHFSLPLQEVVPLFAGILTIPLEHSNYNPAPFSVEQQKLKIVNAMLSIFMKRAQEKNLLLVFEDLHWMDDASLELINQLINQSPKMNLLTIVSFRPQFEPTWRLKPHLIMMPLSNLFDHAVKAIIKRIAKGKKLPENLVEQIVKKTDGVPLFVEELTKMVLNSDMVKERTDTYELCEPISSLAIPNTLHDSLLARLDTMNTARSIAQVGAIIGRDFEYELIRDVSDMPEEQLRNCLDQLVDAELLVQSGAPPKAAFTFRHALIRDAAYQSLLKSQQQELHRQVASVITNRHADQVQEQPATLAYHFEKGREWDQAISYWILAGGKARQYQALEEALGYLQRALDLLPKLEDLEVKQMTELTILAAQAPILLMTAGWGSRLIFNASKRLEELSECQGDKMNLFRALRISTIYELFQGVTSRALTNAEKTLVIAKELERSDFIAEAYRIIGQTSLFNGDLNKSKTSFAKAISLNSSVDWGTLEFTSGNPIIISQAQSGHVLWMLGYPNQALDQVQLAVEQARTGELPYDQSICLFISSFISYWVGNIELCRNQAIECKKVSEDFGHNMFALEAITFIGASEVIDGKEQAGLKMIGDSISIREQRAKIGINLHTATFADLCRKVGEIEMGLQAISKSLRIAKKTNTQHFQSEIFRIKGDLLSTKDGLAYANEVAKCYETSMEIARAQKAKSLELRTAISLARWQQSEGKITEGLDMITGIYSWFKEGFETKDLQEAKKLIDELTIESLPNQST